MSETTTTTTRTPKAACVADHERETLAFTFADQEKTVKTYAIADYSEAIVKKLALHGLEQKLRDCYASKELDAAQAGGVQQKVHDQLVSGEWNAKRGDGSGVDSMALLVQAIKNVFGSIGQSIPTAWQDLESMTKEARAEIRSINEIATELAVLRAAKRKPGSTLADMLAKVNG